MAKSAVKQHEDTITYYGNVHVCSRPTISMCRCEILFWL